MRYLHWPQLGSIQLNGRLNQSSNQCADLKHPCYGRNWRTILWALIWWIGLRKSHSLSPLECTNIQLYSDECRHSFGKRIKVTMMQKLVLKSTFLVIRYRRIYIFFCKTWFLRDRGISPTWPRNKARKFRHVCAWFLGQERSSPNFELSLNVLH